MFEEFKVGDKVAIRTRCGNITTGYTVDKLDKVKLIIRDDVMGYFRKFSTRTGKEYHENTGWTAHRNSYIISLEEAESTLAIDKHNRAYYECWKEIKAAANDINFNVLKEKMQELEKLIGEQYENRNN